MKKIKDFNYDKIYKHPRLKNYKKYAELVIISLFDVLKSCHSQYETLTNLNQLKDIYKILIKTFAQWLIKYSTLRKRKDLLNNFSWLDINISNYENTIVYDIKNEKEYSMAILDYISGMTDQFALKLYSELTTFS